jgi:hypothetical protein
MCVISTNVVPEFAAASWYNIKETERYIIRLVAI